MIVAISRQEAKERLTTKFVASVEFYASELARLIYEANKDKSLYHEDLAIFRKHYYSPIKEHGIIQRIGPKERQSFDVVFTKAWYDTMKEIGEKQDGEKESV